MGASTGGRRSSRGTRRGGKGGGSKRGKTTRAGNLKWQRKEQGGSLPKRPDLKGVEDDRVKERKKPEAGRKAFNKETKGKLQTKHLGGKRREDSKGGPPKQRGHRAEAEEAPRKRKLTNGQERLRALLDKHPHLLQAGESADAAVAACFKKAGRAHEEAGDSAKGEGDWDASAQQQQQQQLSGSKRRKLLRLVMSGKAAEQKVFVHESYQLYNEILRSIRTTGDSEGHTSNISLKNRISKAVRFLEAPLVRKDRHSCTARLAQVCLKHSEGDQRVKLWELLFNDFLEFCCCKSFHHVAMKLFLYGTEQQRSQLVNKLASRRDVALTKNGAAVWEYIYTSQKNSVTQQRLLNCLMLESAVLVAVPKVNDCHSFSQVVALLSDTQRAQALESALSLIQKFVDKELLNKAHVHRILKGVCSVASPEQLTTLWKTIAEGALHLATTKDGVEAVVRLLGYANAKERKTVVKALKQHCVEFATNPVDCPLLLRLLLTVDDTKLLTDHIIKELMPAAKQLAFDQYGHFLLLQLLQTEGICKQLPAHYQELLAQPSPTSLKAQAARQSELRPPVAAAVSAAFAELPLENDGEEQQSISDALKDGFASKVLVQLSQHADGKLEHRPSWSTPRRLKKLRVKVRGEGLLANLEEAEPASLRVVAALKQDLHHKSPSLISHPVAQRTLSALMKAGGPSVLNAAWTAVASNLKSVLETKGVFVALQIFKTAVELKLAPLEAEIRKQLGSKRLAEAEAAVSKAGTPATGIQILRKELES